MAVTRPRHRVVVTGMGVVCPLGGSVAALAEGLFAGRSGIRTISVFDASTLPTRIAGESELPPDAPLGDRKIAFAIEAARQAMRAACARGGRPAIGRDAVVSMGVGLEFFSAQHLIDRRRPGFALPTSLAARLSFLQTPSDLCVHLLAREHGLHAPPIVHVSACAAGADAIGHAYRLIASGRRRAALAGGTDSMVNPLGVAGFCALRATSTRNDEPDRASRPFDGDRDGFVMGEGAGAIVLERRDDALARGATIHAEVSGFGSSLDAHGISEPHPEGRGAAQAIRRAIDDAGLTPEDIGAINAHGTGTPKNDPVETLAIKRVFGDRARSIPISATKSMIGHLISAAGAVEAIAAILGLERQAVHPTRNLECPDPACDLDYVPGAARAHAHRHVLSTSYGFGGHNAAIILSRADS